MSITIEESPEQAIETFARLTALGHFAKAATLFEDVLKSYIDELPVFSEYANFLIQQGMYGVLLDHVKERSSMKTAAKPEEEEIVYLELLQALSMLHFEGRLLDTLRALEHRSESYAAMIKPPTTLTFIQVRLLIITYLVFHLTVSQIRSVEIYLAILTAIISVVPEKAITSEHNVTVELPQNKTYVFETGASNSAKSAWVELRRWCDLLAKEHPNEAVNAFRTLLPVLAADKEALLWAGEFVERTKTSANGPESMLATIGAMNGVMWLQRSRPEALLGHSEISLNAGFQLLDSLYDAGRDVKSQQVIELELSMLQARRGPYRPGVSLEGLADIAREEGNYRLESRCLQVMVAMNAGKFESPISAILPLLSSGALYTHFAQDAIELVNFLDHVPSTDTSAQDDFESLYEFPSTHTALQNSLSIGSLAAVRIILDRGDEAQTSGLAHQAARKGYGAIAKVLCDYDRTFLLVGCGLERVFASTCCR